MNATPERASGNLNSPASRLIPGVDLSVRVFPSVYTGRRVGLVQQRMGTMAAAEQSLSKDIERIALSLGVLPVLAEDDQAVPARRTVLRLQRLVRNSFWPFIASEDRFAFAANDSEIINIRRLNGVSRYSSAHQAAIKEANTFLDRLWFHLEPNGREKASPDPIRDGLDVSLIETQWERSRAGIEQLLHPEWQHDFALVHTLIQRERGILCGTTANTVEAGDKKPAVDQYVTLAQMAAIVSREKRTMRRLYDNGILPLPDRQGGKGKAHEWRWSNVRPVLEREYTRELPSVFPTARYTGDIQ